MKPDFHDGLFVAGLLMIAGSLGWFFHPALALLTIGVACVAVGLWGALRAP